MRGKRIKRTWLCYIAYNNFKVGVITLKQFVKEWLPVRSESYHFIVYVFNAFFGLLLQSQEHSQKLFAYEPAANYNCAKLTYSGMGNWGDAVFLRIFRRKLYVMCHDK